MTKEQLQQIQQPFRPCGACGMVKHCSTQQKCEFLEKERTYSQSSAAATPIGEAPQAFTMQDFEKGLMLAGYVSPRNYQEQKELEALQRIEAQKGDKDIWLVWMGEHLKTKGTVAETPDAIVVYINEEGFKIQKVGQPTKMGMGKLRNLLNAFDGEEISMSKFLEEINNHFLLPNSVPNPERTASQQQPDQGGERDSLSPAIREAIITYIYDFAWQYGRFWHVGDAEKIKEAISERFILPEEFIDTLIPKHQNNGVATEAEQNPDPLNNYPL